MSSTAANAHQLVDVRKGLISRDLFVSEELYEQEKERVFARSWLFVGHESQVPNPNDFFVSRMGEESVILTRTRQGEIQVLLNTCMHRGMKVCRYDEGNTPVFSCPYHGWSYSTDGKLVSVPGELIGVPQFATAYHGELQKEQWGLVAVPKMCNYKGGIWACWDKDAPDFLDYLGDMRYRLDETFNDETIVFGGVQKWLMPCNWKFAAENFIGDFYHSPTHRSVNLVGISPSGGQARHLARSARELRRVNMAFPQGHGTVGYLLPAGESLDYTPAFPNDPVVEEYYRARHGRMQEKLKHQPQPGGGVGTVFPNMSFGGPNGMAVWHPAGPHVTEAWRWYFVDKDAPNEVKQLLRHYQLRYSGPVGLTESDDAENWNYATYASNGTIARRYPYNYNQGIGHETPGTEMPGSYETDVASSEQNARILYKRWAEFMDAESWEQLSQPGF